MNRLSGNCQSPGKRVSAEPSHDIRGVARGPIIDSLTVYFIQGRSGPVQRQSSVWTHRRAGTSVRRRGPDPGRVMWRLPDPLPSGTSRGQSSCFPTGALELTIRVGSGNNVTCAVVPACDLRGSSRRLPRPPERRAVAGALVARLVDIATRRWVGRDSRTLDGAPKARSASWRRPDHRALLDVSGR